MLRAGEKVVSPKQGYSRPGENGPEASVLSIQFSPKRDNFRSSEGILAQALFSPKLNPKKKKFRAFYFDCLVLFYAMHGFNKID